jgi:ABC-type transport system substrate-binding protein
MKIAITILLVILAVLATGCTTQAPAATAPLATSATPAPLPAIPTILGTWTGTMLGYDEGLGYSDYGNATISMIVTEQQGRLFSGTIRFSINGTDYHIPLAGAIGRNGRTFALVEEGNGYTTGEIISNDEIQLTHMDNSKPISVAIDTLKKV